MANIKRCTTPTIQYTFRKVAVSDIATAFFTINMDGEKVLEKDLSEAAVGENTLAWTLSQDETLRLTESWVTMQCNWVTEAGLRGASDVETVYMDINLKNEVIA